MAWFDNILGGLSDTSLGSLTDPVSGNTPGGLTLAQLSGGNPLNLAPDPLASSGSFLDLFTSPATPQSGGYTPSLAALNAADPFTNLFGFLSGTPTGTSLPVTKNESAFGSSLTSILNAGLAAVPAFLQSNLSGLLNPNRNQPTPTSAGPAASATSSLMPILLIGGVVVLVIVLAKKG